MKLTLKNFPQSPKYTISILRHIDVLNITYMQLAVFLLPGYIVVIFCDSIKVNLTLSQIYVLNKNWTKKTIRYNITWWRRIGGRVQAGKTRWQKMENKISTHSKRRLNTWKTCNTKTHNRSSKRRYLLYHKYWNRRSSWKPKQQTENISNPKLDCLNKNVFHMCYQD